MPFCVFNSFCTFLPIKNSIIYTFQCWVNPIYFILEYPSFQSFHPSLNGGNQLVAKMYSCIYYYDYTHTHTHIISIFMSWNYTNYNKFVLLWGLLKIFHLTPTFLIRLLYISFFTIDKRGIVKLNKNWWKRETKFLLLLY